MSINGSAPHYFILDTGAGVSAVDAALAAQLGLPTIAETELAGTAGVMTVQLARIAHIAPLRHGRAVDNLARHGMMPTTQDLSAFDVPVAGAKEAGLLGNDYLQGFVVHVRLDQPKLDIARSTGAVPAGVDRHRFIPFSLDDHTIVRVKGKLDGWMDVDLRFDTGSATMTVDGPYLNITTPMWQALCQSHPEYQVHETLEANAIGGHAEAGRGDHHQPRARPAALRQDQGRDSATGRLLRGSGRRRLHRAQPVPVERAADVRLPERATVALTS